MLGNIWKPFADTKSIPANVAASALMVVAWGYFLIQGVTDELGGIKSLWPLFGIANQLLAAIALCLATTIVLKMQLVAKTTNQNAKSNVAGKPIYALVMLLPLLWLLTVTMTAGWQKIFHDDPKIGFLTAAKGLNDKLPTLQTAVSSAKTSNDPSAIAAAEKALSDNRKMHFNNLLDAGVAGIFMAMVVAIFAISVWEWIRLLTPGAPVKLHESEAVWLPEYSVAEAKPVSVVGVVALSCALARELSGEAHLERAQQLALKCNCVETKVDLLGENKSCTKTPEEIYVEATEKRFTGINRCC